MKVTVKREENARKYPCLMESDGLIVLFLESSSGIVVSGNEYYSIGTFMSSWKMDSFVPFKGSITISS